MTPITAVREALEPFNLDIAEYGDVPDGATVHCFIMGGEELWNWTFGDFRRLSNVAAALAAPIPSDAGDDLPVVARLSRNPEGHTLLAAEFTEAGSERIFAGSSEVPLVRLTDAQGRIARDAAEMERSEKHRNELMDRIVSLKTSLAAAEARATAAEQERDLADAWARDEQAKRHHAEEGRLEARSELAAAEQQLAEARAALAAHQDAGAVVRVKPLEWDKCEDEDDPSWEVADTILGRYSIERENLRFVGIEFEETVRHLIATSGNLKAAAQADYEARILSALAPDEERIRREAAEEAARYVESWTFPFDVDDPGLPERTKAGLAAGLRSYFARARAEQDKAGGRGE